MNIGISSIELVWLFNIVLALFLSVLLSNTVIPSVILISMRKRLFDEPNERKVHSSRAISRLGGVAFKPIFLFSTLFVLGLNLTLGREFIYTSLSYIAPELIYFICATILLYVVGVMDDLVGVGYRYKFVAQFLAAVMVILSGMWINNLGGLAGVGSLPEYFGYAITAFMVIFVVNSINLIDGIDGLASGLSGAALLYYTVMFFLLGSYVHAMLAASILGVLIPFFYYNVFGGVKHNKKIFMGDTGALTVGFALSFFAVSLSYKSPSHIPLFENAIVLAFAPLIIPCLDVLRVAFHRMKKGRSPFLPDKNHIHHKILRLGLSHRKTMVLIVLGALTFTVMNLLLSVVLNINIIFALNIILWISINMWLTSLIKRREARERVNN